MFCSALLHSRALHAFATGFRSLENIFPRTEENNYMHRHHAQPDRTKDKQKSEKKAQIWCKFHLYNFQITNHFPEIKRAWFHEVVLRTVKSHLKKKEISFVLLYTDCWRCLSIIFMDIYCRQWTSLELNLALNMNKWIFIRCSSEMYRHRECKTDLQLLKQIDCN